MDNQQIPKKGFDIKYILLGGGLTLFLVMIGVAIGFLFFYNTRDNDNSATTTEDVIIDNENDIDEDENLPSYTDYIGTYVQTKLPEGWTVVEHVNGDGGNLVSGMSYTGLTGLEVKNPSGTVYFKITALYGIGGTAECQQVFVFSDTSQSYLDGIAQDQIDMGAPASQIINLGGSEYVEYTVLGHKVRRIDDKLYWNSSQADDDEFLPSCGFMNSVPTFSEISFTIDNTDTSQAYSGAIVNNPTDAELLELDVVLSNLKGK